ncbi:MAG: pyridoxamine 5'-phosphate oxidase family protein [Planctomycetes bacterium]|nr:pyridoxamine 5'-phosphate oxidase family protein [Planctomycetota bacterium]
MCEKDEQKNDAAVINDVLSRAKVCRLGLCDGRRPYVVPVCFGYADNALYFHTSGQGKKIDILRRNNNVCFEAEVDCELVEADKACKWDIKYKSVIGFGTAVFIDDTESKRKGLDVLMRQYSDGSFEYSANAIENIAIIKVEIESMTGKQSG